MEKRVTVDLPEATESNSAPLEDGLKPESIRLAVYDIPLEVVYDERPDGRLKIGFVYPDNEESVARNVDPEVSFRIGKHSGKIIGIDLAAGLDPLKRIGLLTHRIHQSIPALTRVNQRLNYRLIGDVLNAQARMHLGS